MFNDILRRLAFAASVALLFLTFGADAARAQATDSVYLASQLTSPPKIASVTTAASLVNKSYPEQLKRAGIGGSVQLQFVVGSNGEVEKNSVEVVAASVPALGDAAKTIADKIPFHPGKVGGTAVRTLVLLPLTYRP